MGSLHVVSEDEGSEITLNPGIGHTFEPNFEAWVLGDEEDIFSEFNNEGNDDKVWKNHRK